MPLSRIAPWNLARRKSAGWAREEYRLEGFGKKSHRDEVRDENLGRGCNTLPSYEYGKGAAHAQPLNEIVEYFLDTEVFANGCNLCFCLFQCSGVCFSRGNLVFDFAIEFDFWLGATGTYTNLGAVCTEPL